MEDSILYLEKEHKLPLKAKWRSPSNIALVKYWGKYGLQLPKNASVSFTLSESYTEVEVEAVFHSENKVSVEYFFEEEKNRAFEEKIRNYLEQISGEIPFLRQFHFSFKSRNTFPHSAGIASSASSMSALALIICDLENQLFSSLDDERFYKKASHLARLGSGSAARSVYGGVSVWGKHPEIQASSDEFAISVNDRIHPVFKTYQDAVLIVDAGVKHVSSRLGHALMNDHAYAAQRFVQAQQNATAIMEAMKQGNVDKFIKLVESEALSLHAMMMTSSESYMLLKPNTLSLIEKIRTIREQQGLDICFTLDAGPNVHLLYPEPIKKEVQDVIRTELIVYCERKRWINDHVGVGPEKIY